MAVAMREVGVEADGAFDPAKTATLNRLREAIAQVQAAPRRYLVTLGTGLSELDALGLFRLGRGVELCGEEASGRASLAGRVVAGACREKRLAAWVDGPRELYPPALVDLGVELSRLLVVRPKAPKQLVWSAVQLLRSGAFTCVVLDVTHTGVKLTMLEAKKLVEAARTGGSLLVLLTSQGASAQGLVRLELSTALTTVRPEPVEGRHPAPTSVVPLRIARGGQYGAPSPRVPWSEVLPPTDESISGPEPVSLSPSTPLRTGCVEGPPTMVSAFAEPTTVRPEPVEGLHQTQRQASTSSARTGSDPAPTVTQPRDPSSAFRGNADDPAAQGPSETEVASWSARRTRPERFAEPGSVQPEPVEGPRIVEPSRALDAACPESRAAASEPITCFTVAHGSAAPPVRLVRARVVPRNAQRRAAHLRERGLEPAPVAQDPSLQRQRTSLERNGYGMRHSRPGRDSAMTIPVGAPPPTPQPEESTTVHPERSRRVPTSRPPDASPAAASILLKLRRFG